MVTMGVMRTLSTKALRLAVQMRGGNAKRRLQPRTMPAVALMVARAAGSQRRTFATNSVTLTFVDGEGIATEVTATEGQTLLEVAHDNDVELEGACGGELACSTCHLVFEQSVFDKLPEISEEEEDMLDLAWGLTDTSRLGCQIKVTKDLDGTTVRIPDETDNLM